MDFVEIEKGYSSFYKGLIRILRKKDLTALIKHISKHPREAGRFSHLLGLSPELAEIEMFKAILRFKNLKELHYEALEYLRQRGIQFNNNGRGAGDIKKRPRRRGYHSSL